VGYPEGWTVLASPASALATFAWDLSGRPIAQLTVFCNKEQNQSVESLMAQDAQIISEHGGVWPAEPTPVQLGAVSGKEVEYTTSFGSFTIEQVAVYAVKGDCGWRIGFATYGGAGGLQAYRPLFERILASFRLD
jgi:hypothetical protein